AEALDVADEAGYPVIFKAAAGGGGRGMRIVRERASAAQAFAACQAEAGAALGSSEIYCEEDIDQPRHAQVQVLRDPNAIPVPPRIAAGEPLGYRQDAVRFEGHAIECRINAEDPETFVPSAGRVTAWVPPGGFGVRVDSHLMAPYSVPPFYDSLLGKIIVHGRDRAEAIERMRRALRETVIEGVKTTIPFHFKILSDPAFVDGRFTSADGARLHP